MDSNSLAMYGSRDQIKELANRLQKMMQGAAHFTEGEALAVAQIAIAHGLDPFNGEVWGIKYQNKSGEWVWAGTMVGVKGLRKAARRQGNFWTEFRRVEPQTYSQPVSAVVWECHLRDTDRIQAYGKGINALTSSGMPYTDAVQMLGPAPVYVGVGIANPEEKSKMSIHARAKKRAEADAIKQAYDVSFGSAMIENGAVIDGEILGVDDDHVLPAGQVVELAPRPAEQVLVELGVEPTEESYVDELYVVDEDGNVVIDGQVIGDAPQITMDLEPKSLMTLEMAENEVGQDGIKYGDKATGVLASMANTINRKIKEGKEITPEKLEDYHRKLDAIKVILADRQGN